MIRACKILLLVAGLLPAQITFSSDELPHLGALSIQREREGITLTATHQSLIAMRAAQMETKGLALYEVLACSATPQRISTARIRAEFSRHGLQLQAPLLGLVTAEAKRGKLRAIAEMGRELAPGGSVAAAFTDVDPFAKGLVLGASLLIRVFVPESAPPVVLRDKAFLEAGPNCDGDVMLAKWPSRGRGPASVTVEVR